MAWCVAVQIIAAAIAYAAALLPATQYQHEVGSVLHLGGWAELSVGPNGAIISLRNMLTTSKFLLNFDTTLIAMSRSSINSRGQDGCIVKSLIFPMICHT